MSDLPTLDGPALRRHLAVLLPPRARGYSALMALVVAARDLERRHDLDPDALQECLATSYGAARRELELHAWESVPAASCQDVEDAVASVWARIFDIYRGCREPETFSGYLRVILANEVRRLHRGRGGDRLDALDAVPEPADPGDRGAARLLLLRGRALRRFAWFHWGSPDHPGARSKEKLTRQRARAALVEFAALSANLEGRPYRELVYWNQPRPGDWGPGEERGVPERRRDENWWRNRAAYSRSKFKRVVNSEEGQAELRRILRALGGLE